MRNGKHSTSAIVLSICLPAVFHPTVVARDHGDPSLDDATGGRTVAIWVEVNSPQSPLAKVFPVPARTRPDMRVRDYCLEALGLWSQVQIIDTVIISTRPGNVEVLYPFLMERAPDRLRIIGGLKTYILPGATPKDRRPYDYADPAGWQRLTEEAMKIVQFTGERAVLLESETALTPFHSGEAVIAYDRLRDSLRPLHDTGITALWWYPAVLASVPKAPRRQFQTTRLVQTVAHAVPRSVFIVAYGNRHDWRLTADEPERRKQMTGLVGPRHLWDILYVTMDGYVHYGKTKRKRCYTPAEALNEITSRPGNDFVLYPCAPEWVQIGKALLGLMPRRPGE